MKTRQSPLRRLARVIWGNWQTNQLWQRILKNSIACTIALIIAVIPRVVAIYGLNTYLIPMTAIFAHPGQRMGKMVESLLMIISGSLLGLGWSMFGLHMSDLVIDHNPPAASSIRAVFLLTCAVFHGYVRSKSPRLFVFVWFFLIASVTILLGRSLEVTLVAFTSIEYPILTGSAVVLTINLAIFPEHSTSYLGSSTITTTHEAVDTLTRATHWFVTPGTDDPETKEKIDDADKEKSKSKRKTWWQDFLSDFPNPFETTGSNKKDEKPPVHLTKLSSLADKKSPLRSRALACKSAQNEVNFEFAISPLEPKSLKPISKQGMTSLVQNTITLIGACENKFVLLKNSASDVEEEEVAKPTMHRALPLAWSQEDLQAPPAPNALKHVPEENEGDIEEDYQKKIEDVKPLREIGMGSADLLESLLKRVQGPSLAFETALKEASSLLLSCLAYCYDVPKLPSGVIKPRGIELQEIDIRIDSFTDALHQFDAQTMEELRNAALDEAGDGEVDLMPRMEMFLVSSFLLSFRQAATHILAMLRHARTLVEQRQKRKGRSTIWLPHHTDMWQWLSTSGEEDGIVLPESARKEIRTARAKKPKPETDSAESSTSEDPLLEKDSRWGKKKKRDEEVATPEEMKTEKRGPEQPSAQKASSSADKKGGTASNRVQQARNAAADTLEWAQHSDDLVYALKLATAVFIVSWPSFVPSWRAWYGEVRGIWAPLQLVLVFEVSIGTSLFIFVIRLVGVIFGCTMGLLSYEIGSGNRIVMVVVLVFGIVPAVYIQLGTKYVKAGMIAGVTMCVVALAAMNQSGTAVENFYKRLVAFLVGSCVAILVEVLIMPVRARDRLVESLSSAVRRVQDMQSSLSVGVDSAEKPNFRSHKLHHRFSHARDKAQGALAAAETFLPFCLNEPRLKGSFKPLEPIYKEIIYVLHQIIDRMDNVVDLRKEYGSSVLEDLHFQVFAYRRNVAASNTLMLFAVHEALTTWLPLPQFLPSSRLAQSRLVNRVREIITSKAPSQEIEDDAGRRHAVASIITDKKFLSWNASTAGYMELIEYLEELVELTKLLVGVNAFRSGLLERPQYKDYVQQARTAEAGLQRLASRRSARSSNHVVHEERGAARLRRAAGVVASVQRFRQATEHQRTMQRSESHEVAVHDDEDGEEHGREDADDGIPMSLRRVGTRLQRNYTAERRRRYTSSSRGG